MTTYETNPNTGAGTGVGTGTGMGTGTGITGGGETHYFIYDISADLVDSVKDSADPYAVFELGEHSVKTAVAKNAGSNPVWTGDQYRLRKHHGNEFSHLNVSVYAKKTLLPDGLIGRGDVALSSITSSTTNQRVPLTNKKGESTGYLSFQCSEQQGAHNADYSKTSGMGTGVGTGVGTGAGIGTERGTTGTGQREGVVDKMKDAVGLGPNDDHNRNRGTGTGTGAGIGTGVTSGAGYDDNTRTTTTTTTERVNDTVCDRQTFTTMEDRPVIKEQKIYTKEHHPYEKQYAVETKFVGEKYVGGGHTEALGVEERVVDEARPAAPCADAPAIGQQALGNARNNPTY